MLGARAARSCKWTNRSIACRLCAKLCSGKLLGQKIERWSGQSSWPTWWLCWVLALPFRIAMPLATNNPARARRAPSGFLPKFFPSKKSQDSKKSIEISKQAKTCCFRWQRSKQSATTKTAAVPMCMPFCLAEMCSKFISAESPEAHIKTDQSPSSTLFKGIRSKSWLQCSRSWAVANSIAVGMPAKT